MKYNKHTLATNMPKRAFSRQMICVPQRRRDALDDLGWNVVFAYNDEGCGPHSLLRCTDQHQFNPSLTVAL
jgi:hypothetical protein